MNTLITWFTYIWRIPLALLSFSFYRVMRPLIRRQMDAQFSNPKSQIGEWRTRWRPISAKMFTPPLALPAIMTTGPRWNPHAIIASVGPLDVKNKLTFDPKVTEHSAAAWTLVVYNFPGHHTVAHLGSMNTTASDNLATIQLPPGRYMLGMRYYHWGRDVVLPAILVDDTPVVDAQSIDPDVNNFYHELKKNSGFYYRALHYYVYFMLRWQKSLPASFVEREFLPIGNPETQFRYGYVEKGDSLTIRPDAMASQSADIYLVVYNRASFPIFWTEIKDSNFTTPPMSEQGFYLVRIHPHKATQSQAGEIQIDKIHLKD